MCSFTWEEIGEYLIYFCNRGLIKKTEIKMKFFNKVSLDFLDFKV